MQESWEAIAGRPRFRIGGEDFAPSPGEIVVAPAGVPHVGWNAGDGEVHVRVSMRPALRWEDFVVELFSGEVDIGELMSRYPDEIAPR